MPRNKHKRGMRSASKGIPGGFTHKDSKTGSKKRSLAYSEGKRVKLPKRWR